jgi:hypothetical protein
MTHRVGVHFQVCANSSALAFSLAVDASSSAFSFAIAASSSVLRVIRNSVNLI